MLNGNSNGILAPARRSEEYTETPDTMWAGVDRIRRSEESTETPDTMWDPRHSVESINIPDVIQILPKISSAIRLEEDEESLNHPDVYSD